MIFLLMVIQYYFFIIIAGRDYLEDIVDAVNVSQVLKILMSGLPESVLSNGLVKQIVDECTRLTKLPAGTIGIVLFMGIYYSDLNLETLIGLLKQIRMPYIGYLTRVVKIWQNLLNNATITKLDVKTIATTFSSVMDDTSILEPDLAQPLQLIDVVSIFTIFYDLLFVPIMQQINAELQAASQAANMLKRQESIRPGLHRRNSLSLSSMKGEGLASLTSGIDPIKSNSSTTTPRSRGLIILYILFLI